MAGSGRRGDDFEEREISSSLHGDALWFQIPHRSPLWIIMNVLGVVIKF